MTFGELVAEPQRLRGDHDAARGLRLLLRIHVLEAQFCLGVEPALRDEHRKQAEHDGERDHYDGAGAHGVLPGLTRQFLCASLSRPGGVELVKLCGHFSPY